MQCRDFRYTLEMVLDSERRLAADHGVSDFDFFQAAEQAICALKLKQAKFSRSQRESSNRRSLASC